MKKVNLALIANVATYATCLFISVVVIFIMMTLFSLSAVHSPVLSIFETQIWQGIKYLIVFIHDGLIVFFVYGLIFSLLLMVKAKLKSLNLILATSLVQLPIVAFIISNNWHLYEEYSVTAYSVYFFSREIPIAFGLFIYLWGYKYTFTHKAKSI